VSVQPKPEKREAVCVALRTVLIRDDRDEIGQEILREGDASGNGWADVIDTLTMYPDVRRRCSDSR
jgi:Arc/MetJ family transcription regulator